jgi:hypothetical protein
MNQDYAYWFNEVGCHGDKVTFEVCWRKINTYRVVVRGAKNLNGCILQPAPDGTPMFAHRCGSKFSLMWFPDIIGHPLERECLNVRQMLSSKWNGLPWLVRDPDSPEAEIMRYHGGMYECRIGDMLPYRLTLFVNGFLESPRAWDGYWSIVLLPDQKMQLVIGHNQRAEYILKSRPAPLRALTRDGDGKTWRGRWDFMGGAPVELKRLT